MRYEIHTPWTNTLPSPIDPARLYQEFNIQFANSIDFCVQISELSLAKMHAVLTKGKVQVVLDLKRKELDLQFPLMIDDESHRFRFRLPLSQLTHVYKTQDESASSLIIPFGVSPQFFIQKKPKKDDESMFSTKDRSWKVWSTWFRETDVVNGHTRRQLQATPLMNHKDSAIIDIGETFLLWCSAQANRIRPVDCLPLVI